MSVSSCTELDWAHPVVRDWFLDHFGSPTEPQTQGWPHILSGRPTLICSPTGSGKTLAAFLACINVLVTRALENKLSNTVAVVYVSPLKALSNDIQKNLETPLREISELAESRGLKMVEIRTAVRTGDTEQSERRLMLKKPPHILVTTPESLYILLTSEKSRAMLANVETVIVDEIHAVVDDKRGAHLALCLERLDALTIKKPNRIGLSATQKPIELTAQFLSGAGHNLPAIVDLGHHRKLDISVEIPDLSLGPVVSNEMWEDVYQRMAELANEHRSTLVFVNTRKQAERVAMNLTNILGQDAIAAHHGSLSRKLRLAAERKLKNGEIKVLVATASLELGIDIGFVDLVCQIGSPRSVAAALQRIGRAGHWRGAIPKGRLFAMTLDELVEIAALVRAIRQDNLDRLLMPEAPLDILAQQIVAMCAAEEWNEDALFSLVKQAFPYRDLSRQQYDQVISMLSDGISARRGRYGSYLMRDQVNNRLKGRRGAKLTAITSGGAIPGANVYSVMAEPEETTIGTLDEDFAIESNIGDIFLLGNTSWRIRRVESRAGRVLVEDAHGAAPTVPFWLGEGPSRTKELSDSVCEIREEISRLTENLQPDLELRNQKQVTAAISWLMAECGLSDAAAQQLVQYIVEGRAALGVVPTKTTIVAERFFDEGGGMQLIIHAPFGMRINKAWGLALRKKFCRSFNFELQAAATDNGLNISLAEQHSFLLSDVFYYINNANVRHTLEQASLAAPVFTTRWRWDAVRSLALPRFKGGKKVPPYLQRLLADDLLAAVFPDAAACQDNRAGDVELPQHPLIDEVMKDVLHEAMDLPGLEEVLQGIASGAIQCIAVDTPMPSVFCHEILNANPYAYLDDAPLEERRARAVELRRVMPDAVVKEFGKLDPAAIERVGQEIWPDIRDADELHDFLLTVIALPEQLPLLPHLQPAETWQIFFEQLRANKRVSRVRAHGTAFWVAAERARTFGVAYKDAEFENALPQIESEEPDFEVSMKNIVRGWMSVAGPITAAGLQQILKLPKAAIDLAFMQLESTGNLLRGDFTGNATPPDSYEWCDRRVLARIHNLTIGSLRKQIEPVTPAQFVRWLARWQHVAPGTQLSGERGVLEVLKQLQGFEIPANAWEGQILAKRVSRYNPSSLDRLCLTGAVGWGRVSPHPATLRVDARKVDAQSMESKRGTHDAKHSVIAGRGQRRILPSSVAPITFYVREDSDWLSPPHQKEHEEDSALSTQAKLVRSELNSKGASFFADIVRGTSLLKVEVETALWELVSAGFVTADGFDNMRALIDPRRRAGRRARNLRPRHSTGRWSLFHSQESADPQKILEATCRMLLQRYGVVFRELLVREANLPRWHELLHQFRLMENSGEIRGGRFVSGFIGEQFALPEALESLRITRNKLPDNREISLSAADPLNLSGIILPGDRVPAVASKSVSLQV